jgi:3-dehydroquinate synthase
MHALPELLHGEAVMIDMALTTALAARRGDVSTAQADRIYAVAASLGLPLWNDVLDDPALLEAALLDTVRHRDGRQRLPLPVGIGRHRFVDDVTPAELREATALLRDKARAVGRIPATASVRVSA